MVALAYRSGDPDGRDLKRRCSQKDVAGACTTCASLSACMRRAACTPRHGMDKASQAPKSKSGHRTNGSHCRMARMIGLAPCTHRT